MKDLIDINEVCEVAKISKPTVYRRVKAGTFPKPKKIKSKETRGPKYVNRWERGEIMGWLLKGNKPEPLTLKEIAVETEPGLNELFMDAAMRNAEGADLEDIYKADEPKPKPTWYIPVAVMAALLGIFVLYLINA